MHRLTTDTPKDNFEMALNLFYVKDKEVWVRGYGKNGADISLFDLSRDLTRWNCPYVDLDISDDSFSMMMAEWLWEDVESFEHVLALLYQAAWVCAELREHLKQFEDTKRTPEQIEALEAAIMGKEVAQITEFEGMPIARLRELAMADQEGRVVVLPCKVGERWTDEDGRAVRITAVIVSIEPFGMNINIYFDYEDATPDDAGSDCVTNWDYFSRHYTCIEAERALAEMEGMKE